MAYRYLLYQEYLERNQDAINRGEPIEMEIRDQENFNWFRAKAIVSREPMEGSGPAAVLAPFGEIFDEGKWHVKILEELPLLEEES